MRGQSKPKQSLCKSRGTRWGNTTIKKTKAEDTQIKGLRNGDNKGNNNLEAVQIKWYGSGGCIFFNLQKQFC